MFAKKITRINLTNIDYTNAYKRTVKGIGKKREER